MSFKMILNSHNSLFAHIFFNSHFIRYQRLKEQGASSYGLFADIFSYTLKSPQKSIYYKKFSCSEKSLAINRLSPLGEIRRLGRKFSYYVLCGMKNFYGQFIAFAVVKCVEDFGEDGVW